MSPGRWAIAAVMILMWGSSEAFNFAVSAMNFLLCCALAVKLNMTVKTILQVEDEGGKMSNKVFWFRNPRFVEDVFVLALFQQAFSLGAFIFGLWEVGTGDDYECYYGPHWRWILEIIFLLQAMLLGGYVILPLQAVTAQMSDHFRAELLGQHTKKTMQMITEQLARRRSNVKRFATQEAAVLHIQRAFRARQEKRMLQLARRAIVPE
jgi:mlo protein